MIRINNTCSYLESKQKNYIRYYATLTNPNVARPFHQRMIRSGYMRLHVYITDISITKHDTNHISIIKHDTNHYYNNFQCHNKLL